MDLESCEKHVETCKYIEIAVSTISFYLVFSYFIHSFVLPIYQSTALQYIEFTLVFIDSKA